MNSLQPMLLKLLALFLFPHLGSVLAGSGALTNSIPAVDKNVSMELKGSIRQARDYTPPSATQYMAPAQSSYAAPASSAYSAPMSGAYAAPAPGYGAPAPPMMMHGGYGVPSHYAIPPIVMGSSDGYSDYGEDTGGGGSDYKELLGLLGLKGLKGLKGVKAAKAAKGLGLLALAPILLPLLLLLPFLLLIPLLLPLLLLFLIPIPVIAIPDGNGRRRRSANGRSIFEDTLTALVSNLPPSISSIPPAQLSECLDNFVCQTGDLVHRTAPTLIQPASWLLTSLWPTEMHHKVKIFETATRCSDKYKCKVKKLENLFSNVVYRESVKLKNRIQEKVGDKRKVGWADLVRIIFE